MSDVLKNLQPRKVFEYFEAINEIPRGSGNEKGISDYLVNFAKDLGLEVKQDEAYNVYIKKPASKGYEHLPAVILQGHMDMVCEKNKETVHDFEKDGLKLYIDGDWIGAEGTTLGGDDGIAIAYQMAILADNSLKHPALECFMTTDEERGMTGVSNMHPEYLSGKLLINLDNEVEGEFLVSCAGGAKAHVTLPFKKESISEKMTAYKVIINGLKGGHSGSEIHLERANAHILMGRFLKALEDQCAFKLVDIEGGSKDNVITRECDVTLAVRAEDEKVLKTVITEMDTLFKGEYSVQDPDICITLQQMASATQAIDSESTHQLIQYLTLVPNGVLYHDHHMENLVETSLNLGVLQIEDSHFHLASAIRSSVASRKEEVLMRIKVLCEVLGLELQVKGVYPAWQYSSQSKLRDMGVALFEEMYGHKPKVTAIHAGLECGFIAEKCPGLDMISIGPDMQHIHSPEEVLSISSTARVYEYLVKLLEKLIAY